MRIRRSERGQALAEYMPLFPPVLLLAILILMPVSQHAGYIYCRMVNALEPQMCEVVLGDELPDESTDPEDDCVVLQEEEGGSQCDQSEDCSLLPGINTGTFWASSKIEAFVIKAGQEYHIYTSGITDDGCYYVGLNNDMVSWDKVGTGPHCKDISHSQAWKVQLCQ
jgi:hypothetical protein